MTPDEQLYDASLALAGICDTDTAALLGKAYHGDDLDMDYVFSGRNASRAIAFAMSQTNKTEVLPALRHLNETIHSLTGRGIIDLANIVDNKLDLTNEKNNHPS